MGVPMIKYRCTKCNCATTREERSGRPPERPCSKGGTHSWKIERKM